MTTAMLGLILVRRRGQCKIRSNLAWHSVLDGRALPGMDTSYRLERRIPDASVREVRSGAKDFSETFE
jgi:hypothetical protein